MTAQLITAPDGVKLAVAESGPRDAPAILFMHSVGCDRHLWDAQISHFSKKWRTVAFDWRGHGESDAPDGDYNAATLAGDALAILDALDIGRAHLCGLSLGGTIGMELALSAPDRIANVTLCGASARMATPDIWNTRIEGVRSGGMAAIADFSMTRFFSDAFRAESPDVVARYRERFAATKAHGYMGCCAVLRDADYRDRLGQISAPSYVIGGLHDSPAPPPDSKALAAGIPGAGLTFLDAGHLCNIEASDAFNAALAACLEASAEV